MKIIYGTPKNKKANSPEKVKELGSILFYII